MKSKGFTLIEVLILVAILGIIVSIAIPQLKAYRDRRAGIVRSPNYARPNFNAELNCTDSSGNRYAVIRK